MFDNCVPRRQLGSCSVTRPFSLWRVWLARLTYCISKPELQQAVFKPFYCNQLRPTPNQLKAVETRLRNVGGMHDRSPLTFESSWPLVWDRSSLLALQVCVVLLGSSSVFCSCSQKNVATASCLVWTTDHASSRGDAWLHNEYSESRVHPHAVTTTRAGVD